MKKVAYTDETRQALIDEATTNGEVLTEDAIIFKNGISGEKEKYMIFVTEEEITAENQ